MTKTPKRPRDPNQLAHMIIAISTGENAVAASDEAPSKKGGVKGGRARAMALTPSQRKDIARLAAEARWKKN
jgi:hypothetical protein